jgi:peptide/nickel transport system substrate-binding protein
MLPLSFGAAQVQAQQASQQGDHDITVVVSSAVDVVEPCHMMSTGYIGQVLNQNVVESLIELNPENSKPEPLLATSWKQIDPDTWQVALRHGVKFQDGADFNADAVVKTFERLFSPQLLCRDKVRLFPDDHPKVTALDPYTVEIKTEHPEPLMPITLSQIGMTSPNMSTTEETKHPVGTGPYSFTSWDPTTSLVLTRFDGYWGKKPEVAKATYVWRDESALRASMVAVGEADIAMQIAPQDATNPKTDFGYLNANTARVRFFMDQAPLNDIRIRKAMNLAVDRQAFVGTVLPEGVVPASQYMLPNINGYDPNLKVWPYDPEQAKKLVAEAKADGVDVSAPITLVGAAFFQANADELYQTLIQYWNQIGLNVKLQMVDKIQDNKIRHKPFPSQRPNATMVYETHDNTAGDAFYTMMVYYTSEGDLSNLTDKQVDDLLHKAAVSTGEERTKLFQQANDRIQQEIIPDVILFHLESFIRVGPRVNYKPDVTTEGRLKLSQITFN